MTITNTDRLIRHECNGVATSFAFGFPIKDEADLKIAIRINATGAEAMLVNPTNYTVSDLNGTWANGGTVNIVSAGVAYAYPAGYALTLYRETEQVQESEYEAGKALSMPALKANLDNLTMMVQDLKETAGRCLKLPITDAVTSATLPSAEARSSTVLSFTAAGALSTVAITPPTPTMSYGYYSATLAVDGIIPYDAMMMIATVEPSGADRNVEPDNSFPAGSVILLRNTGAYALTFNGAGLNYTLGAGERMFFTLDGSGWG
jgi:hypothetical protein